MSAPTQFLAADTRGSVRVTITDDGDWRFTIHPAGQPPVILDVPSADGTAGGITAEQMCAVATAALRLMPAATGPEPEERTGLAYSFIGSLVAGDDGEELAATAHLRYGLSSAEVQGDRECLDMLAATLVLVSALQADVARLEGERDAMRPVVEALGDLLDAEHALDEADDDSGEWKAAEQERDHAWDALVDAHHAAVDQVEARTARSEPQSDAEGSGVAQDVREALGAQKGAQGAEKCRCGHDGEHHTWRGSGCELCFGCDSFERTDHA